MDPHFLRDGGFCELCDKLCDGSHEHEHVIGGATASLAGRYPPDLLDGVPQKQAVLRLREHWAQSTFLRLAKALNWLLLEPALK